MLEWWTYSLHDFLLFSPRVYWRTIELHNRTLWPLQVPAILLGTICALLVVRPRPGSARAISVLLAAVWIWVAWSFLWKRYATINWAVAYMIPAYVVEALLLVWLGVLRKSLLFNPSRSFSSTLGLTIFLYALILHPFAAIASGRTIQAAEVFGIHPDPTAFATLGVLLLARGRNVAALLAIPVAWCVVGWTTLYAMGAPESWIRLAVIGLSVASKLAARTSTD
jgi:hypothetical protein